ncbi:unnamed protein product [Lampetra planeri]
MALFLAGGSRSAKLEWRTFVEDEFLMMDQQKPQPISISSPVTKGDIPVINTTATLDKEEELLVPITKTTKARIVSTSNQTPLAKSSLQAEVQRRVIRSLDVQMANPSTTQKVEAPLLVRHPRGVTEEFSGEGEERRSDNIHKFSFSNPVNHDHDRGYHHHICINDNNHGCNHDNVELGRWKRPP